MTAESYGVPRGGGPIRGLEYFLLREAGDVYTPALPANAWGIARRLGLQIRLATLRPGVDGQTCWTPGNPPVVEIDSAAPRTRQTFTVAHEIGHVLLADSRLAAAIRRRGGVRPDHLEAFCNRVAAEILLPARLLRPVVIESDPLTLPDLQRMAATCSVSPLTLVNRLSSLGGSQVLLSLLRCRDSEWVIAGRAGPWRASRVSLADTSFLERVGEKVTTETICVAPTAAGTSYKRTCQARRRRGSALLLLNT